MGSKEELEYYLSLKEGENRTITSDFINCLENAYKDLERLEKLEEENKQLKAKLNRSLPKIVIRNTLDNVLPSLEEENEKLKQENKELLVNKNVAQGIATKYKKALDIIKRKIIYVFELKFSYSVIEYNISARNSDFDELTKEEYELLKEVLGNE